MSDNITDIHVSASAVVTAVHWAYTERTTGRRVDPDSMTADVSNALAAAYRLAADVLDRDNAVVVRGGAVVNDPPTPVIDLDFLDSGDADIEVAGRTLVVAESLGWPVVAAEVRAYLDEHASYDREAEMWIKRADRSDNEYTRAVKALGAARQMMNDLAELTPAGSETRSRYESLREEVDSIHQQLRDG